MGAGTGMLRNPRPVSTVLMWVGLFTVSWERLANIGVGGFNLKLSTIAFALAFVLTLVDHLMRPFLPGRRQPIVAWAVAVVAVFAIMGLFAVDKKSAAAQLVTVILGALLPFAAVYINIRVFGQAERALTWFIRGGWLASVFGLYQLLAFYAHLPQGIVYQATTGGLGRISAFNYEAAYFADFILLVIAALVARSSLRGEAVHRGHLVFFVVVLLLANSRAAMFFALPLFAVLLLARRPKTATRARIWPIAIAAAFVGVIVAVAKPSLFSSIGTRLVSVFNTHDTASNAPRLQGYATTLKIARDHLLTGIGGGNLILYNPEYGLPNPVGATSNSTITNNVWLQALMDGGILLFLLELTFVTVAIATLMRKRNPASRALMAGYVALAVVAFMLTSVFFTSFLWVVLAIAAALDSTTPREDPVLNGGDRGRSARVRGPVVGDVAAIVGRRRASVPNR